MRLREFTQYSRTKQYFFKKNLEIQVCESNKTSIVKIWILEEENKLHLSCTLFKMAAGLPGGNIT